jgi:hypothetical protein
MESQIKDIKTQWLEAIRSGRLNSWKDLEPTGLLLDLTNMGATTTTGLARKTDVPEVVLNFMNYAYWHTDAGADPKVFLPFLDKWVVRRQQEGK